MKAYRHQVQYFETDMMGIVHPSCYVRWMEEAALDFLDQLGFPYREMEKENIYSLIRSVSCKYKHPCTFGDNIDIQVEIREFNGVVAGLGYEMTKADTGETVCSGKAEYCFLNKGGHFVILKKALPAFYTKLAEMTVK